MLIANTIVFGVPAKCALISAMIACTWSRARLRSFQSFIVTKIIPPFGPSPYRL
ncbi:mexY domain protein [Burkholderia pseudomallei ABCPW 1]|nr:mexY domain protein [Burkholderia pseudomallei ABCPW 1]